VQPAGISEGLIAGKPYWLYATRHEQHIIVYRSVLVHDHDPIYQPVKALIKDMAQVHREVVDDDTMMNQRGELLIFKEV
jgi:hypothetical protein